MEGSKPSPPPFLDVMIDYFGPFIIRGEVQKRTRGETYGDSLTCMSSRTVHLHLSQNYSRGPFMQLFRRYTSVPDWPKKYTVTMELSWLEPPSNFRIL